MRRGLFGVTAIVFVVGVLIIGWRFYLVSELKKPVLVQLSDPESAQFQNLTYVGNWTVTGGVLCGQVNAKNLMGGYAGYQWFTTDSVDALVEDKLLKETFDAAGLKRCDFSKDDLPFWYLRW